MFERESTKNGKGLGIGRRRGFGVEEMQGELEKLPELAVRIKRALGVDQAEKLLAL